jgi:DNA-binding transcriptional ArsR family regulator
VEEDSYRQSRLCRVLGNPVAFAIVELLAENKELTPGEIARAVGRSVTRVSNVLGSLRLAEVVRYESDGNTIVTALSILVNCANFSLPSPTS